MKLQELFEAKEKAWFSHDRKAWEKAVAALEVDDDGQDFAKSDGKLIAKWYPDRDEGWVLTEAKSTKGPLSDRQLKNVIRSAVMGQRIIADGKTVWPGQETTVINSNKGKMAWTNKGEAFTQKMKNGKFNKVVIKAYSKNGAGYSWLTDEEFDTSALGEAQLVEAKNHLDETEYNSYASWRAALKKKFPDFWIDGDKEIANAMVGPKPFKKGETKSVGEWDGEKGSIYN